MSVRVQDCEGHEIVLGTRVRYGGAEDQDAIVTAISEPDIEESDDEYGRERVTGVYVELTIEFDDGETEHVRAKDITSWAEIALANEYGREVAQAFEEPGDLEVIA